jgi:hypothetical protein
MPAGAHGVLSLIARVLLVLPAVFGLFALRLITRYDLEKLSACGSVRRSRGGRAT